MSPAARKAGDQEGPRAARSPATTRTRRAVAPWVLTRLRTSRGAALLLAALVLGTTFLATALPRTLDRDADHAVTKLLSDASPRARSLVAWTDGFDPATGASSLSDQKAARAAQAMQDLLTAPLAPSPEENAFGARTTAPRYLTDPGLPRPDAMDPQLSLVQLHGQDRHLRLVAGRLPTSLISTVVIGSTDGTGGRSSGTRSSYEIALPRATAERFGVGVGAVLATVNYRRDVPGAKDNGDPPVQAVVVGIFEPTEPDGAFWSAIACLTAPCLSRTNGQDPQDFWQAGALVGPDEAPALTGWTPHAQLFWQIPIDPRHLRAYQTDQAKSLLASILDGPLGAALPDRAGIPRLRPTSDLPSLLARAQQQQAAVAPLYAIGPIGAGAVALVVLLLAAGLALDRRQAELALLRARGGSLRGIGGRLLAETAVVVLPAGAAGTALALLLLPTPRWTAAVLTGAAAVLLALLAFPVRAVGALRAASPRGGRRGPGASAPRGRWARLLGDPRRLVTELGALALATAAVLAVRRRGVAPADSSIDYLLSSAPLLLAVAGAVVLARAFPLLLTPGVRWAARRPGAIGFLGLARAGRTGGRGPSGDGRQTGRAPTVLPLLALLLAVTTAGFGVTLLTSSDAARQAAVRQTVGGDARVSVVDPAGRLPDGFVEAAAKLPGVRSGTSMVVAPDSAVSTGDGGLLSGVIVIIVDPPAYAELARRVGVGQFDPALLDAAGAPPGAPVPALVSDTIADRLGSRENTTQLPDIYGTLRFTTAGRVHGTPLLPNGGARPVVVVSAAAVLNQLPGTKPLVASPTSWFGLGDGISGDALRGLLVRLTRERTGLGASGTGATPAPPAAAPSADEAEAASKAAFSVATRAAYAQELADDPLHHAAGRLFWTAVAAGAGYSVLSLLLTLLRAAPERAALLARLRTMGLRPRQGLVLILVEALPQALIAAAAGAGLAYLTAPLLGSAVNLSVVVGATVPGGLQPAFGPVAWQAAGLAVLSTAVVLADTLLAGRRQISTELRAGDQ